MTEIIISKENLNHHQIYTTLGFLSKSTILLSKKNPKFFILYWIFREIVSLANEYKALVFVDDCHGTGLLGKTGRGTEEFLGISGSCDIINSTLGKALGGAAGKKNHILYGNNWKNAEQVKMLGR